MLQEYKLTQLHIYPVKSLGGIAVSTAFAGMRGLHYDRRWMLVDEKNCFMTQREHPLMATIGVKMQENGFALFKKSDSDNLITIPFATDSGKRCTVTIFDDQCDGIQYESATNEWLSDLLKHRCRLIYMPDDSQRMVDVNYAPPNNIVSFADGYPFLIIGEASLNELNGRLENPVPMNRFRPNFVFSGGEAFTEDNWIRLTIGDATFLAVKRCARCVITTTDQETGERFAEPLRTMSTYRKEKNNVYFGQNLIAHIQGRVSLNDQVTVFV